MLSNSPFYHGTIRQAIVSFGRLFSDVRIERKQGDSVNGVTSQTLLIPISMAPKEKWIVRLEQDPTLENHMYMTLPRMSFEITGYGYDSTRHLGKMNKISCHTGGASSDMFVPVPYNIDITLYVITKTQEDAMQIIEQILPVFNPEYTLAINAVPGMNIVQDIPVTLNSISVSDEYDGDFQTRRFVTHTLTFTLKLNLFGPVNAGKRIYKTEVSVSPNPDMSAPIAIHTAIGDPVTGNIDDMWSE